MNPTTAEAIRPPGRALFLSEGPRAVWEMLSLPAALGPLANAPRGDGHPVMVIPGFVADDTSTRSLRRYLDRQGWESHGWELGRNLGPRSRLEAQLMERMAALYTRYEGKISLIGQSLGGIYAREVARWAPQLVRQVITLGSPFGGTPGASSNVQDLYEEITGTRPDELNEELIANLHRAPPVPTTAIYSRADGIVSWQACVQWEGEQAENIEVPGSHVGMGFNPLVLYAVAERLAQAEGEWRPFARRGWRRALYPEPVACRRSDGAARVDAANEGVAGDVARIAATLGQAAEEAVESGIELAEKTVDDITADIVRLAGDLGPSAKATVERGLERARSGIQDVGVFDFLTAGAFAEALGAQAQGSVHLRGALIEQLRRSASAEIEHLRRVGRSHGWCERRALRQEHARARLEDRVQGVSELARLLGRTAVETMQPFLSRLRPRRRARHGRLIP